MTVAAVPPFATPVVTPRVRVAVARDDSETSVQHRVVRRRVGAGYFSTLGIPTVRGRDFDERDQRDTDMDASERIEIPVVLNSIAMQEFFGDGNPIDRRIRTSDETFVVVGLAGVTAHAVTRRRKEMGVRIARAGPSGVAARPQRKHCPRRGRVRCLLATDRTTRVPGFNGHGGGNAARPRRAAVPLDRAAHTAGRGRRQFPVSRQASRRQAPERRRIGSHTGRCV